MKSMLASIFAFNIANAGDTFTMLPSSCADLEDGLHYIQPMGSQIFSKLSTAEASPIRVYCSNGYTIIDPSLDNNVINYFSSYHKYHTTFAGPDLDEGINWRVWWLPTRMDFNAMFMVSEDCQTVEIDNNVIQVYNDQTAYYMTGDSYGCNWPTKAMCDFDSETLECFTCSVNGDTTVKKLTEGTDMSLEDEVYYGKCGHMPLEATSVASSMHSSCTEDTGSYIPSIGTTGKYCVAYKLSTSSSQKILGDESLIDYGLDAVETVLESEMLSDSLLTVYLDQEDFLEGTYRITKPGTYIITEDIEFDFNAGSLNDPNFDDAWFPLDSQSEDYPGAGEWDGHYWLGFFAGITIESDNVILDLNNHDIGMSAAFYFQQRFFSCIELNNKIFLDGEGPTWTGTDITYAENVVIKDGTVGLTSHIGIHGNKVTNLKIENVHVRDFETHGIGINEYYNLELSNVEIGPSIDGQLGVSGNYNLARYTLPIFRSAAEDSGIREIQFSSRSEKTTFTAIVRKLTQHMNMVFKYAYFGEITDNDEFDIALKTFYNDWGISRAGTIYGALLRSRGASVFNYGKDTGNGYSDNLVINGLYIHDIKLAMEEIIALGISANSWMRDVFNAPLNLEAFTNNEFNGDISETTYVGNAYLDSVFALKHLSTSWWYLGRLAIVEPFLTWARELDSDKEEDQSYATVNSLVDIDHEMYLHCNYDSLGHVPKGVIGLRMELSSNIEINDLRIEDLYSFTPLGSEKCGAYKSGTDGGMPLQTQTTNAGFGGTQVRAMNLYKISDMNVQNVKIKNIMSLNGPAYGVHGSPGKGISSNVQFSNVEFEGIYSGIDLMVNNEDNKDWSVNQWPNPKASACAVEQSYGISFDKDTTTGQCIYGHVGCDACNGKDGLCSDVGQYNDECSNVLSVIAKDTKYVIEADGSVSTEVAVNEYKDALTRLGDAALTTVSKTSSKQKEDTEETEEEVVSSETSESKLSSLQGKNSKSHETNKLRMKNIENKGLNKDLLSKDDSNGGMSDRAKLFLYGSLLVVLLILVVVSKRFQPKYRSRKNNTETFESKMKYGKHGEKYEAAMEAQKQDNRDKTEEMVRLVNNTVGNSNDKEYTKV